MAASNFNYQVALKEGLKSLQQGRLRQAEQSFKYLVDKFPGAEGGYRGLAKVHFEQEDRPGALKVLRDGAAALSRSGERSAAIGLLREAITLEPRDLATHRRLAAALALAGDMEAAVQEYARYIRDLRESGEVDRADLELAYALGQLKDAPTVASLRSIGNGAAPSTPGATPETRSAADTGSHDPWAQVSAPPSDEQLWSRASPSAPPSSPAPVVDDDPWGSPPPPVREGARQTSTRDDPWGSPAPAMEPPGPVFEERVESEAPPPAPEPVAAVEPAPVDMAEPAPAAPAEPEPDEQVEAAAARYLATRDPRAAAPALEAARRYLDDGRTDAASDLLLQLIASGVADHDAQRLLVEVARTLGKHDLAKVKCQLLVQALLLDGRNDLAAEVEALAQSG